MRKIQSGYTLVELSVALALAGTIVLASVAGTMSLIDQQRVNDFAVQNADAIKRINDVYAQLSNYNGLSLRQAVSFGAFRQFIINNAGTDNVTVTHPFGGAIGVAPINNGGFMAWGLYLNAVPAKYCSDLLFQAEPLSDALVVFPDGMANPVGWAPSLGINTALPAIIVTAGFGGSAPIFAKNLNTDLAPNTLGQACNAVGNNFGVLLVRSKLR
ncbi:prepilin-type N-terminal cleavage/methylation domain-containing protein [Herbaspirillum sp. DW155]|uniref:PulJ/GspJ family protein n=1 Tax=Herbaspirillum sp. DW155 TaxID=3095609 RepID=UPI00308866C0|nr:prepilin-type N-terminal cleavage/methylation domain-containing protein [Herbaspirillum sp. DW155]